MTYAVVVGGFTVFFAVGATGTALAFSSPSFRQWRGYAWRIWLWGSIGVLLSTVFIVATTLQSLRVVGLDGKIPASEVILRFFVGTIVLLGPLAVSGVGAIVGSAIGIYFGWRKTRASCNC